MSAFSERPKDELRFYTAVRQGNLQTVKKSLKEHPHFLEKLPSDSAIPIHIAAIHGQNNVIELLVSKGASVDHLNSSHQTPMHMAVEGNHFSTIEMLFKMKSNAVNVRDQLGNTPLHYTTIHYNSKVVKLLVQHGGDINALNNMGDTILDIVVRKQGYIIDEEKRKRLELFEDTIKSIEGKQTKSRGALQPTYRHDGLIY